MAGQVPFIDLNGGEVANFYRTASYLRNGLGPLTFNVGSLGCDVMGREVGGLAPFVSPSVDPAPWYDSTVPESAEFLGFVPSTLDFQTLDVKRTISQRFGGIGGGVIGVEQFAARGVKVSGILIASTCAGLEYGRHWFYSKLGADCAGCSLGTIRLRESCPPSNGSNDTRGERILYDAAVVDGITRDDDGGFGCCEYDGLSFTMAGQSPYLYSRQTTPTANVMVSTNGNILPPLPAALDTFVRADQGPPPSASWTGSPFSGSANQLKVVSNLCQITPGAISAGAYWNAATFGPDSIMSVLVPTRNNNQSFGGFLRLTNPGVGTGSCLLFKIRFGTASGGSPVDFCTLGRINTDGSFTLVSGSSFLAVNGDTFVATARGHQFDVWRISGGVATRIGGYYDPQVPVAGRAGLIIEEQFSGAPLSTFGAGTLPVNAELYPLDPTSYVIPAVSQGITSPIVTLSGDGIGSQTGNPQVVNIFRVQTKHYLGVDCSQADDFSSDTIASDKWTFGTQAVWGAISTGAFRPNTTGVPAGSSCRTLARYKDSAGVRIRYLGGKTEAKITTGASVANGYWAVGWVSSTAGNPGATFQMAAYLIKSDVGGTHTNLFALCTNSPDATVNTSVAFTPLPATSYRIICEAFPVSTGGYDVRGYLVDPVSNIMLCTPLRFTFGTLNVIPPGFVPAFGSRPAGTDEAWDNFAAIDYTDEASYIEADMPTGTLIIDASRRVSEFTLAQTVSFPIDGSTYLTTPIDTPLGWSDNCPGQGPACLQIWSQFGTYRQTVPPGANFGAQASVALQSRVR